MESFHLSSLLQRLMPIKWSTLDSWTVSHVVVRGFASVITVSCLLSTSSGQPLCSSYSRLVSPLDNFLNHYCTVSSLAIAGPNALLMLQVVSSTLGPILNLNKKIVFHII